VYVLAGAQGDSTSSWGISDESFLVLFAVMCVLAVVLAQAWRIIAYGAARLPGASAESAATLLTTDPRQGTDADRAAADPAPGVPRSLGSVTPLMLIELAGAVRVVAVIQAGRSPGVLLVCMATLGLIAVAVLVSVPRRNQGEDLHASAELV
jgi:hypothetical protein